MVNREKGWRYETTAGEAILVGDVALTPHCRALTLRWPGGGWIWNRPVSISVEEHGMVRHLPIVDVTRLAQWTMMGLAMLFVGMGVAGLRR